MSSGKSSFLDKVLGRIGRLDAHGLKTVVQRLARERSFLETLFNTIEDGVLVVDERGRVLYYNQAISLLLGVAGQTAEGRHVSSLLPEMDWERLLAFDTRGGHKVARHEFEISYPRARFLRLYAAPLDGETSGSSGMALILHDATEARQRTFEAIESERISALTLLAASVAHEIGNPLNALHIHLQLMEREVKKLRAATVMQPSPELDEPVSPGQDLLTEIQEIAARFEHYLQVASGEITRLDYIVTQFLQAIRPTPPQFKPSSLNQVASDTVELLRLEIENRGQLVSQKLDPQLPNSMMDPDQIKQVLVNLIKNAMQAMSRGGVLTVETGAGGEEVWVSISDTGAGIPGDQLNRLFEPFFTTKKKGSGLGLMIVQRIIRAHGGRLEVSSPPGKGTTFRIWLPLRERQTRLLEARANG